uniref:NAD(P)(+)--arginine ADP-ribosyltransferase n=1 Tax=Cyprinus carpio TaxID=7962 RepID=A0A8C2HVG1_CYPCA
MLLIIEALLLISAALGQDHRAAVEGQIFPLNMALNSVDDQYKDCRKNMADLVKKKYLNEEMSNSKFANGWKHAEDNYKPPGDDLTKTHSIAIYVYTNSESDVYKEFNEADRDGKDSYKTKTYKWYSLHFLLTDAIQILNKTQNKCYDTYRGTSVEFKKPTLNKEVRFGSFTSSSGFLKKAQDFGTVSCFEIHTCEGAYVKKYSKYPEEEEVLIPPYEKFNVTAVKKRRKEPNLWCETVYVLNSTGPISELNCALFKKPTKTLMK